jgi:hypothetical protein
VGEAVKERLRYFSNGSNKFVSVVVKVSKVVRNWGLFVLVVFIVGRKKALDARKVVELGGKRGEEVMVYKDPKSSCGCLHCSFLSFIL